MPDLIPESPIERTPGMSALAYADFGLGAIGTLWGGYVLFVGIDMLTGSKADSQRWATAGCDCLASIAGAFMHLSRLLIVYGVASIVVSLLMIAAGVGVLRMLPWGRTLSLVVAVLFIAAGGGVIGVAYSVPVIVCMMKPEWKAAFAPRPVNEPPTSS
ncbi:MAG: hypothetical protein AB7O62_18960 [Pirellulales bacterium]